MDLEELNSWASTMRESLENENGGSYNQQVVDPKVCLFLFFFCKVWIILVCIGSSPKP